MKSYILGIAAFIAGTVLFAANVPAKEDNAVLDAYVQVSQALAADDLGGAKQFAVILGDKGKASGNEAIATHAKELAESVSLEKAREHFKLLSAEAANLAGQTSGYYVMTCLMAKADWVQATQQIANPYLGKKMPNCGEMKSARKAPGLPRR